MDRDLISIYKSCNALKEGHFVLSSGRHSNKYIQSALVLQYPKYAEDLGCQLAKSIEKVVDVKNIDAVVSPAIGALFIGYEVAKALSVKMLFVERKSAVLSLRRGFKISKGRYIVIEDVVTTGGSLLQTADIVKSLGGDVIAAGALVDRGSNLEKKIGVPYTPLLKIEVESYDKDSCPMCKIGLKTEKPGSNHK